MRFIRDQILSDQISTASEIDKNRIMLVIALTMPTTLFWSFFDLRLDNDNATFFFFLRFIYVLSALSLLFFIKRTSEKNAKRLIALSTAHFFSITLTIAVMVFYTSNFIAYVLGMAIPSIVYSMIMAWKPRFSIVPTVIVFMALLFSSPILIDRGVNEDDLVTILFWYSTVLGFAVLFSFISYNYVSKITLLTNNLKLKSDELELKNNELSIKNYDLKDVNSKLVNANKRKDQFLAVVSHELRTPLNGIIGLTAHLTKKLSKKVSAEDIEKLNTIHRSGIRLNYLINDILDFSKIRKKGVDLQLSASNVKDVVNDVLSVLSSKASKASKANVAIINSIHEESPLALVDNHRFQQILFNLISNSIKFTHQGSIDISSKIENNFLKIYIKDTGIGISNDKLDIIFNEFEQADSSISRAYGGTGLGLSITKQLIELHGGNISVSSVKNQGTTFCFTVPIAKARDSVVNADSSELSYDLGNHDYTNNISGADNSSDAEIDFYGPEILNHLNNLRNSTILIVDDEKINLEVASSFLSSIGCHIQTSLSGKEALEAMEQVPPDLILLDIMMPEMNGFEVAEAVRKSHASLPIVMLTALREDSSALLKSFTSGVNDFLSKPYKDIELFLRLESHLRLYRYSESLEEEVRLRTAEAERNLKHAIEVEKQTSLNTITAGVAHELNTPIYNAAIVSSELANKSKELKNILNNNSLTNQHLLSFLGELEDASGIIKRSLDRSSELVKRFKKVSVRQADETRVELELHTHVNDTVNSLRHTLKEIQTNKGISVHLEVNCMVKEKIESYPGPIGQILQNLILNAYHHGFNQKKSGTIELKIDKCDDIISMTVKDNGDGMSDDVARKIFEPFFSTKSMSSGTGLGMSIVRSIVVQLLKGNIDVNTELGKGTTFIITFPAVND